MNPCNLMLFIISNILLIASTSEVDKQKRLQTEPLSSNKRSKNDRLSDGNNLKINVAVIGGGINAALFAHYLHELMNAEVHIYNHGMIEKVENSSFIVHENQKYMMELISKFDLDTKDLHRVIMMYDGQKNALLNFHQNNPIKIFMELYVQRIIPKFEMIYNIQQKELRSFLNLTSLLLSMSVIFPKLLKISTREFVLDKMWQQNPSNIEKIIHSLLLINYGQNLDSNAFAGLTSLIFSQLTGKLKQITTPVNQIIKKLLGESDQFYNLNVSKVAYKKLTKHSFRPQVSWIEDGMEQNRLYDYVVIATTEIDNIDFIRFKKPITVCKNRKIVFTAVKASLKEDIFEKSNLVTAIANVKDSSAFRLANRISYSKWNILADVDSGVSNEISSIFNVTGSNKANKNMILPDYSDIDCAVKASFVFYSKVFYLNAIEWASNLLEMKAIGAKNVALRIKNFIEQLSGFTSPLIHAQG